MKIDLVNGRLGNHRFHMMLVHFPSALFPFSLVMDSLALITEDPKFASAGMYALVGALGAAATAMIYGANDFIGINSNDKAWKTAGIHALLNVAWFIIFSVLLFSRIKIAHASIGWIYLTAMGLANAGLFYSNYLGGELVVKYKLGIPDSNE